MSNAHPNRRAALVLPSKGKHILMAVSALAFGFSIPVIGVALFGNSEDARSEGSLALPPPPQVEALTPLDDESLETPDLLAGEVPEGINPTDSFQTTSTEESPAEAAPADDAPQSKRIEIPQSAKALPKAPIAGLTQQSNFGPVPSKASGDTALRAYKRPFQRQAGKQSVSLIIGGLGINRPLTQQAIDNLPADVTLSFAAHSVGLQEWIDAARADGHEVLIEIPLESAGFDPLEPGADKALRVTLPPAENGRRLDWMLSRAQGYAGLINFNGDVFLTRADVAATFMDRLSQTGLGFITDGAFETPAMPALARSVRQPFKTGDGLIDPDPIPRVIAGRLAGLSQTAKSGSHPVGVGFAYRETFEEVQAWIATLDSQNLQLVPATSAPK